VGTVGLTNQDLYAPSIAPNAAPLLVVLGPTGAGKSALALHLARALHGEIVNCDSVQIYRGLEIGSAKLPPRERRGIQHHLIDVVEPGGELTAGAYASLARVALSDLKTRGVLPIVAGGTGFYLRALLAGLSPAPPRDAQLRVRLAALTTRRPAALHRFLRRHDPASAARIHENDHQKLIRAIELTRLAGQPASRVQSSPRLALAGFRVLQIGLNPPRRLLHEALDARSEEMFRGGLVEETRALLESGIDPRAKSLQTLGYKQAIEFLHGQLPLAEALRQCQTRTRQYAKRQMTWFRADPAIHWLSGFGSDHAIQDEALATARQFVSGGSGR
jgi:tRNA dimethylallyltransferase